MTDPVFVKIGGEDWTESKRMNEDKDKQEPAFVSRRTGIDRRWIKSPGHWPERRRGGDRRKKQPRSFLQPLDGDAGAERKQRLPQTSGPSEPFHAPQSEDSPDGIDAATGEGTDPDLETEDEK
ncbi:hypothetical protein DSCO28_12050 [Desulfosarcina ovata subsp. sediminis]|uniref:Uncharacterized protein n=2 Tax=Desulfosarcina ovata TaxID=83564 RepID=A0A5K7ZLU9_9BACT|nr:hypothetical protein DSCO28_12050 [Desulfosarcina ovata subsp. sediminis]